MRAVLVVLAFLLAGCTVESRTPGCEDHGGAQSIERGHDVDGKERPLFIICKDGAVVDLR